MTYTIADSQGGKLTSLDFRGWWSNQCLQKKILCLIRNRSRSTDECLNTQTGPMHSWSKYYIMHCLYLCVPYNPLSSWSLCLVSFCCHVCQRPILLDDYLCGRLVLSHGSFIPGLPWCAHTGGVISMQFQNITITEFLSWESFIPLKMQIPPLSLIFHLDQLCTVLLWSFHFHQHINTYK